MSQRPLYAALAEAFHAEGTRTAFVLTGNGNMHWDAAFAALPRARSVHVRHEHCACAMATAYSVVSSEVGVASVTCGPGLTQIMTALATAVRARIPLVVFAGEGPMDAVWYHQDVDQATLVRATGAVYIAAHGRRQVMHRVAEAFRRARTERRPVVVAVPLDLQQEVGDFPYHTAAVLTPDPGPRAPHPEAIARAAERIRSARRIVILGGRGAVAAGAISACERLAETCDAALACTLPARGAFSESERYIGVSGGYAHAAAREAFAEADLVVAVGTSLTPFTSDRHQLFAPEDVVLIDVDPDPDGYGQTPPECFVCADARLAVEALLVELGGSARPLVWDVARHAWRVRNEPADPTAYDVAPDLLDPRTAIAALGRVLPRDWRIVVGSGHYLYFTSHLYDRPAEAWLNIPEFGAIGSGLSYAIGAAMARPDVPVVLFEGDGGMMMHVQELETIRRYGLKILICVLNDGAFGAEIHRLRAEGLSDAGTIYGRDQISAVARGFGLSATSVRDTGIIDELFADFVDSEGSAVWDIQISDRVLSASMRRSTGG